MLKLNENMEVEYSEDLSNAINELAAQLSDAMKDMLPLERYYVLRTVCEELENRCMMFGMMKLYIESTSKEKPKETK